MQDHMAHVLLFSNNRCQHIYNILRLDVASRAPDCDETIKQNKQYLQLQMLNRYVNKFDNQAGRKATYMYARNMYKHVCTHVHA